MNAVNQITPNGNLTYTKDTWADGTPRYTATQTLSAAGQQLQNTQNGTAQNLANLAQQQSGRLSGLLNQDFNLNGLPAAGQTPQYQNYSSGPSLNTTGGSTSGIRTGYDAGGNIQSSLGSNDFSGDRKRVEDALFTRLNPQTDRDRQNLETSLVNRGIRPGSSAYQQEMNTFNQGLNDQRTSILLNAGQEQNRLQQLALNSGNFANSAQAQQNSQNANAANFGNTAQQQLYGQQMGNAAFANQGQQQMFANNQATTGLNNSIQDSRFNAQNAARQQALQEQLLQRQTPLNELLAVSGQTQIQQPSFANTSQTQVGGTDVAGLIGAGYQNQLGQYNANQTANNQMLGGLFSAGASLLPLLSDRRAKTDIKRIGATEAGTPIYQFRYKHGGPVQIGYMAQDLLETQPDAVTMGPDGFYRVAYEKVA